MPIEILKDHQDDPNIGSIARQALSFLEGAPCRILQTPGPGQSSFWIAQLYEIRMSLKEFRRNAFVGIEESIASLRQNDVNVHLSVIETGKGFVSMWLTKESESLIGLVIARTE